MKNEDSFSIIIGFFIFSLMCVLFFVNVELLSFFNLKISSWQNFDIKSAFENFSFVSFISTYILLLLCFLVSAVFLGYKFKDFFYSFSILFLLFFIVLLLSKHNLIKNMQLESPLLALLLGIIITNFFKIPSFLKNCLSTELYIKTGIVVMGANFTLNLLLQASGIAILQACIVTTVTFFSIYFFATRMFNLEKPFGATLAGGGSICGVSAAIVIGNACKAKKEQISASISIVVFFALIMVFALPFLCKALNLDAGIAGAFIGTSEFADAAGLAAASSLSDERAVAAFTVVKVVGRDMFIGIWALLVTFLSVAVWEKTGEKTSAKLIFQRFPKFILGFFALCILSTLFLHFLADDLKISFEKEFLSTMKDFRTHVFTLSFLCIGLSTNFKELLKLSYKPFLAFFLGVLINLPLGFVLSNYIFAEFWKNFLIK